MKSILLLVALAFGARALEAQSTDDRVYAVGVSVIDAIDRDRPTTAFRNGRPIQIVTWYPATLGRTTNAMTYRAYVELAARELAQSTSVTAKRAAVDSSVAPFLAHGVSVSLIDRWLDAPMSGTLGTLGAVAAPGQFPLVLLAPGNGDSPYSLAVLAEFLASRGYVVAAAPSPMRIAGPLTAEADVGRRAAEQAADLAFIGREVRRRRGAGPATAVVGHSFGARGALLLAMRQPIAALVSLDGGIGTASAQREMRCAMPVEQAFLAPTLHFYEELDAYMRPDFALLDGLPGAERWLVRVPSMHHHHFTSLGLIPREHPELQQATGADSATYRMAASVRMVTLNFLDAFVKRQRAELSAVKNGTLFASFAGVRHEAMGEGVDPGPRSCPAPANR